MTPRQQVAATEQAIEIVEGLGPTKTREERIAALLVLARALAIATHVTGGDEESVIQQLRLELGRVSVEHLVVSQSSIFGPTGAAQA